LESNIAYMLFSGARGNQDQLMQAVGFIGTIIKDATSDIDSPILTSYATGLSSFDLSQTVGAARGGVISTQAETKNAGYATRQAVYMTSG